MKINKEIIQKLNPLFQAIVEGKDIQVTSGDGWMDINLDGEGINASTLIACPESYRIKPEAKYRPFKNAKECWNEMQKHQPFGWVKVGDWYCTMREIRPTCAFCHGGGDVFHYEDMVKQITFADGLPFGVKEEE